MSMLGQSGEDETQLHLIYVMSTAIIIPVCLFVWISIDYLY